MSSESEPQISKNGPEYTDHANATLVQTPVPTSHNNQYSDNNNNNNSNNTTSGIYENISFEDAIDDVHTRFILNLPDSELRSADRIMVQIEQAWWFYEDFICDSQQAQQQQQGSSLPRFSHHSFAKKMFQYSTVLPDIAQFNDMWNEYLVYKRQISNYGCILLSSDYERIVLCQVYNGTSYTLPSGKINEGEDGVAAACRETYEETGFDPSCRHGMTALWNETMPSKVTWDPILQPSQKIVHEQDEHGKRRTCYVVVNVPEDFPFAPVCRKEVSNIVWHPIDAIPSLSTFAVMPFYKKLRKWIQKHQPQPSNVVTGTLQSPQQQPQLPHRDTSNSKSRNKHQNKKVGTPQRHNASNRNRDIQIIESSSDHSDIIVSGLGKVGDKVRWSEEDMFHVNAQILGRAVEYDGNPHIFTEEGLSKVDPHSYRIVGGTMLNHTNSNSDVKPGNAMAASNPLQAQPIYHERNEGNSDHIIANDHDLTPFFSQDGATPWGEVIPNIQHQQQQQQKEQVHVVSKKVRTPRTTASIRMAAPTKESQYIQSSNASLESNKTAYVDTLLVSEHNINIVPTDAQITAKSQAAKKITLLKKPISTFASPPPMSTPIVACSYKERYERDMAYIQNWVANLPKPQPTKYFGLFTLDADAIMAQAAKDVAAINARTKTF
jgi:mRNA-decapping enzyme subunit 2